MKITNDLFASYLQCKYKAFLKGRGESGNKTEYEELYLELRNKHKKQVIEKIKNHFQRDEILQKPSISLRDLKEGKQVILNPIIENPQRRVHYDAFEKIEGKSKLGDFHYIPLLMSENEKIFRDNRLILSFLSIELGDIQGKQPEWGKIIYGEQQKVSRIKIGNLLRDTQNILKEIEKVMNETNEPRLMLNKHCPICEFKDSCREKAVEKDDLSLLEGISEKEIIKQNNKGIFTVTQYSYTYRQRRRKKRIPKPSSSYSFALKALAIREKTIFINHKPDLPSTDVRIYLDIEGLPDRSCDYLIGIVVKGLNIGKYYSFWANCEKEEENILKGLLDVIRKFNDFLLFHYGSYEKKFLKRMRKKFPIYEKDIDKILDKSVNLLQVIYSNIYFPTYSNRLKDIAGFLGFRWTDEHASGIQSLVWRRKWELTGEKIYKQRLFQYNIEDCLALNIIHEMIVKINEKPLAKLHEEGIAINDVRNLKQDDKLLSQFGKINFRISDLEYINKRAYFDYQRSKIYIRTNKDMGKAEKRKKKKGKSYNKINKYVEIPSPNKCPNCMCEKSREKVIYKRTIIDLNFFHYGVKKWIIRYSTRANECETCHTIFTSEEYKKLPRTQYGYSFQVWLAFQFIVGEQSHGQIQKGLGDLFQLSFTRQAVNGAISRFAKFQKKTYYQILNSIIQGNIVHIDETKINLRKGTGYVWVLTNMNEVFFLYKETREGKFLHELLKDFKGVLISDFYSAYDSIDCPQQKCLIHLIRDINNDLLSNPLDEELKSMAQSFSKLLRGIIETIDKYGLKKRNLNKHNKKVKSFFNKIKDRKYSSEIAKGLQKRLEKNEDKLFTFLNYDGVPWNNNNAEYAIKFFAMYRKKIEGFFSEEGIKELLILFSIYQTCRYKEVSFLDFLLSKETSIEEYTRKN